jgi:hypothetical protein
MREWTLTLPRQLPLWEMESRWTPKTSKSDFRGSKLNGSWRSLYHWKALGTQMSKMGSHCSFRHLKHKLWPKEGPGVKLPIWLPIKKSRESTRNVLKMLWGSKVAGVPTGAISGVPREKSHLDVGSVASHRVYYKGEGGGFPQVRAMVNLVCPCCLWLVLAPKVLQLCTNHFVWVVCRPVWVSEACQLFLVPSRSSDTPLYPSKCCELKNMPQLLPLPLSFTWTHIWVLQGIGNASHNILESFLYKCTKLFKHSFDVVI